MNDRVWSEAGAAVPSGDRSASTRYYEVMAAFGDALLEARTKDELWALTARAMAEAGPFAGACVARADGHGKLRLAAGSGAGHAALSALDLRLDDAPQSAPALAWSTREPCLESDARNAPWLDPADATGIGSLLAVPVREGDAVSAVLCISAAEPDAFDAAAQDLCRRVARLLERWLDHHLRLPHLQHQALHDPLTDLPNRRMLDEHLGAAMARARRNGTVVAVGILDLDDFKPINDSCGHVAGDRLLKELGQRLRAELRRQDLLVRLGGDEFAVVVDDLPAGRASARLAASLERLHGAVDVPFDLGQGRSAVVGMSLGVALYPFDGEEIDQLVRQADMAMYRVKAAKSTRLDWWQLASGSQDTPQQDAAPEPFGSEAAALLERAHGLLEEAGRRFARAVLPHVEGKEQAPRGLGRAGAAALRQHGERLAEHFRGLLGPDADAEATRRRAEALGGVHALAGVGPETVVQALGLYRTVLGDRLAASPLTARERFRLLQVAEARLQHELQHELSGHGATIAAYHQRNADPLPPHGTPWIDALQAELDALAALPGLRAVALQRTDAAGRLTVEAHAGEVGTELAALTRDPALVPMADVERASSGGLVGRAWATGTLQIGSDYAHDERTGPWREPLAGLGVRSVMAVPVPGQHDRPVAIVVLYGAWTGQFGAGWTRSFAQGLQHRWERLWRRRREPMRAPALAQPLAARYRERLFGGGLHMYLQPVVDLASGRVVAAEALARLRMRGGEVLSPGTFLPLLGEVELARLFRLTLDQALSALAAWDAAAPPPEPGAAAGDASAEGGATPPPRPEISVNLPPSTLLEPDCPRWIAAALAHHGVPPERLSLELVETEDIGQEARRSAIRAIADLGVRLSIDDLGSGFSSLQRLVELPFHTMKIDQALVGRLIEEPIQTLTLVRNLVRLGQDLGRRVVVEGTSDRGLLEVAAALDARYVQGFGIARPMPLEALHAWEAGFRMPVEAGRICTAAGALAWHWRALRGRPVAHPRREGACPLDSFFRQPELEGSAGARLHARYHEEATPSDAGQRLLDWLITRVQDATEHGPTEIRPAS